MKKRLLFILTLSSILSTFSQAQTPTLSQAAGKVGITSGQYGTAPNFEMFMDPSGYPRAVTAGETVFSMGSWPSGKTPTFSDDKSNTWAAVTSCTDSQSTTHGFFYAVDADAGTSVITHTYSSSVNNEVFDWAHFYNMSTTSSGFVDGSSCKTEVTPTSNTAPNISGTAYTVGTTGDLILTCVYVENSTLGNPNTISSITWPSGFTGLNADIWTYGHACAYGSGTAGSFTPTFTVAQSTHNTFTIISAAFKAGSGGTAPAAGPSILLSGNVYIGSAGQTVKVYLPCPSGTSAVAVLDDSGSLTGVSDSGGSTWAHVSAPGNYWGPIYYTNSPTITNPYVVSVTVGGTGNEDLMALDCLTGTAGIDTTVKAQNGGTLAASSSVWATANVSGGRANYAPSMGTSKTGDLVVAVSSMGTGPVDSCVIGQCVMDFVGSTSWTSGDQESYANGNAASHFYDPTAATVNFDFNIGSGASSTISGISLAFLQSSSSSMPAAPAPPSDLTAVVH
jgi:hypothetical protein